MADLKVKYLGLDLKNPIIVSSSGLSDSVEKIVEIEKAGAGAVVLKSLFEEQLKYEAGQYMDYNDYPEAADYILNYTKDNSVDNYLSLIEEAKKVVDIPVIASVNCTSSNEWVNFSKKFEQAGADALEVNVFILPSDKDAPSLDYEKVYLELVEKLKSVINIPISFIRSRTAMSIVLIIPKHNPSKIIKIKMYMY